MATTKPITMLVARSRPLTTLTASTIRTFTPVASRATFSTSQFRSATPAGPPPPGFRLPKPVRWNESKESTMDKAGKYFLMSELFRGMYVVLEQYFRPPQVMPLSLLTSILQWLITRRYTIYYPFEKVYSSKIYQGGNEYLQDIGSDFSSIQRRARFTKIPFRRRTMHCLQALRSCMIFQFHEQWRFLTYFRSVPHKLSRLKPRSVKMEVAERPDTISI